MADLNNARAKRGLRNRHAQPQITADAGYHWLQEIVGNFEGPKELHHTLKKLVWQSQ